MKICRHPKVTKNQNITVCQTCNMVLWCEHLKYTANYKKLQPINAELSAVFENNCNIEQKGDSFVYYCKYCKQKLIEQTNTVSIDFSSIIDNWFDVLLGKKISDFFKKYVKIKYRQSHQIINQFYYIIRPYLIFVNIDSIN